MRFALRGVFVWGLVAMILVGMAWGPVSACINLYAKDLKGHFHHFDRDENGFVQELKGKGSEYEQQQWQEKREALEAKIKLGKPDFETRADYSAIRIYLGEAHKVIADLEALEQEKPGESIIASNLGTAYELDGNDEKALHWIREGILRNPKDHEGTEWLHVKILEAKLELKKDPNWLKTHSVLGLDFGSEPKPLLLSVGPWIDDGTQLSPKKVIEALHYQLHERLYFVKPPDPIVAELLADLACLEAYEGPVQYARAIMELALEFKPEQEALCRARLEYLEAHTSRPTHGIPVSPEEVRNETGDTAQLEANAEAQADEKRRKLIWALCSVPVVVLAGLFWWRHTNTKRA